MFDQRHPILIGLAANSTILRYKLCHAPSPVEIQLYY